MLLLKSTQEVARDLADRVRERRLQRGWTQAEMALRAGMKTPTYVLFERTGRIALARLLKVFEVLDWLEAFDQLGRGQDFTGVSLDDLTQPERKRGRRKSA
jgi:transcriptional regulator with XRE-family HTH domain